MDQPLHMYALLARFISSHIIFSVRVWANHVPSRVGLPSWARRGKKKTACGFRSRCFSDISDSSHFYFYFCLVSVSFWPAFPFHVVAWPAPWTLFADVPCAGETLIIYGIITEILNCIKGPRQLNKGTTACCVFLLARHYEVPCRCCCFFFSFSFFSFCFPFIPPSFFLLGQDGARLSMCGDTSPSS